MRGESRRRAAGMQAVMAGIALRIMTTREQHGCLLRGRNEADGSEGGDCVWAGGVVSGAW